MSPLTENRNRDQELAEALAEFKRVAWDEGLVPPLTRLVNGLVRLLRRWPWLYRRLGGDG